MTAAAHTGAVKAAVTEVTQEWRGALGHGVHRLHGPVRRSGPGGRTGPQGGRPNVRRGRAGALEEAQVSVQSICENLLGEVSRLRAANPEATSRSSAIRSAASPPRPRRPHVSRSRGAAGARPRRETLSGDLSRLSRTFSALPRRARPASFRAGERRAAGARLARPQFRHGRRHGYRYGKRHGHRTAAGGSGQVSSGSAVARPGPPVLVACRCRPAARSQAAARHGRRGLMAAHRRRAGLRCRAGERVDHQAAKCSRPRGSRRPS